MTDRETYGSTWLNSWDDDDYVADTILDFMKSKTLMFRYEVYDLLGEMNRIVQGTDTPYLYPTKPLRSVKNPDTIDRECQ